MTITIRPMKSIDKPLLISMLYEIEAFNDADRRIAEEVLDTYLMDGDLSEYYILVAKNGAALAGFVCYGPTPLTIGTWDIYWLAVEPKARRHGIGKQLMAAAEKEMENAGARVLLIETSSRPGYEGTRSFYIALGYEVTARIIDFYAPGDDKIIYLKKLAKEAPSMESDAPSF